MIGAWSEAQNLNFQIFSVHVDLGLGRKSRSSDLDTDYAKERFEIVIV